jgi:two-component system phosphate regulon sensor histidine kinase PhoR
MSYLIAGLLALALLWLGRRHLILQRGVRLLADSIESRRPYLEVDDPSRRVHPSWRSLARGTSLLIHELGRLSHEQASQLAQLETTLGSLQEAVLIIDRDNYILLANKALDRIFPDAGPSPGQRLESVLRSTAFLDYLQSVRSGKASSQVELEFVVEGRTVWMETTGTVIPGEGEARKPWVLFVLHDVTRQKHLESVRREFVANVSHELKTPLSVIKGYAETLVEDHAGMPAGDREEFLRTILRHAERLSAIVDDLLTLSRLEGDNRILEPLPAPVALHALLGSLVAEFEGGLRASGHLLRLEAVDPTIVVAVDNRRMHQVFGNLLDNARKYTPAGTSITVGADAAGGEVVIRVEDDGPGIPAADLPRIFERFYRVEKGRSREKGGTGLGLSIVKHIVQMHGGQVWAESAPTRGLRVCFTLPLRQETATPAGIRTTG